jgi:AraC-like DNA-binding protein
VLGRLEHERRLWYGMKPRFAFVVTHSGRTAFRFRGTEHTQHPGVIQLKQPGEMYRDLRRDGPSSFDVVLFDDAVIEAARSELRARELDLGAPCLLREDPRSGALLALQEIIDAPQETLLIETAIAEAALAFVRIATAREPRTTRERRAIARARQYLLDRLAEAVRLDELADHVDLDKYHLVRAFRSALGVPPYEFLTQARVHRARELLRHGASATAAATAVGYCDQSQLHRHFVRLVGTTPGRYARARRG